MEKIYKHLLDGTNQLIQISDLETYRMIFANKAAVSFTNHAEEDYHGHLCYQYMMGLDEQCPFCPMLFMPEGKNCYETEVDNGQQVFSVKTECFELDGRKVFAEFASDITISKRAQQQYENQMKNIFASVPEAQGIFYMNLTKNTVESVNGVSAAVDKLRDENTAEMLLKSIGMYIPDDDARDEFNALYNREALIALEKTGKTELIMESRSYFDDGSIRWAKLTAKLLTNPLTGDLECIFHGIDITDRKAYQAKADRAEDEMVKIREDAKKDLLTGVYGKRAFLDIMEEYIKKEDHKPFAVAFVDLDNFKQINDTLGHLVGDKVIVDISEKLQTIFRNKDVIARFGGDEFCVLIKDISLEKLRDKLEFAIQKLKSSYADADNAVEISASIGVVYCEECNGTVSEIIQIADEALYHAKRAGKDQFYIR